MIPSQSEALRGLHSDARKHAPAVAAVKLAKWYLPIELHMPMVGCGIRLSNKEYMLLHRTFLQAQLGHAPSNP